ncbi:MAG: hypothetical protein U5M50_09125 [Sphingobium sp.]|nr:hypothetical protein [Sphingobium sp.]
MAAEGYQGGGTVGGKWGCAFAALVGLPLFSGALIIASMGHCAPDKQCLPPWSFFAFATIVTSTVGWGVRAVINRCARGKAPAD